MVVSFFINLQVLVVGRSARPSHVVVDNGHVAAELGMHVHADFLPRLHAHLGYGRHVKWSQGKGKICAEGRCVQENNTEFFVDTISMRFLHK